MLRTTLAVLVLLCLLSGCRSGPASEWRLESWGDGRGQLSSVSTVLVKPLENLPDVGSHQANEVRPQNWEESWPGYAAGRIAEGISATSNVSAVTEGTADLIITIETSTLYAGDATQRSYFTGSSPETLMETKATVTTPDGTIVAVLNGSAREKRYSGMMGGFPAMTFRLGEDLGRWIHSNQ